MIYLFFFGGVCIFLGLYFFPFGGVKRLKGIKCLSAEERANIRLTALGINIAAMLFSLGAIFLLSGGISFFGKYLFKWFVVAWFALAIADAVFICKSKFFFKNKRGGDNGEKRKDKKGAN